MGKERKSMKTLRAYSQASYIIKNWWRFKLGSRLSIDEFWYCWDGRDRLVIYYFNTNENGGALDRLVLGKAPNMWLAKRMAEKHMENQ